jgi:hypothetical protein
MGYLSESVAAGDWSSLRQYAHEFAARCRYHPLPSQAIVAVIPQQWTLSGGIFLTTRKNRICKTGLVIRVHPEIYGDSRSVRTDVGDVAFFTRIGMRDIAFDTENEIEIVSVREEDMEAILKIEGDDMDLLRDTGSSQSTTPQTVDLLKVGSPPQHWF